MSKWSENPMKYYFDWSASIMFLMFLVHLPKTPFKFDNKDTELNPVITGANINLFLTFPRAQISLITSMLFSYLANKINNPLWSHWHIFPSPEQSMFPWGEEVLGGAILGTVFPSVWNEDSGCSCATINLIKPLCVVQIQAMYWTCQTEEKVGQVPHLILFPLHENQCEKATYITVLNN